MMIHPPSNVTAPGLEVLVVVVVDHLQVERQVGVMQAAAAPLIVAWNESF